jgi:hypothetical protein
VRQNALKTAKTAPQARLVSPRSIGFAIASGKARS